MDKFVRRSPSPKKDGKRTEMEKDDHAAGSKDDGAAAKKIKGGKPEDILRVPIENLKGGEDFQKWFSELADTLINHSVIVINKKRHRLAEIEFYFHSKDHKDPYPHMDELQQTRANWYFHRTGKNYRGGTYKGLDITIGNGKEEVGGILIRSLEALDGSGEIVNGPCKCVDHILKLCQIGSIAELVNGPMKKDVSVTKKPGEDKILYLDLFTDQALPKREMISSGRVGLNMSKPVSAHSAELQKHFLLIPYRFLIADKAIAKGRHYAILALHHEKKASKQDIIRLVGCKADKVESVLELMESGRTKSADSFIGKKMADDDVCTFYGAFYAKKA